MTIPGGQGSRPDPDEQELARAVDASAALQRLLAAASAPPSSEELKGRSRALAAFRAAHRRRRAAPADLGARSDRTPLARAGRWSAAQFAVVCAALLVLLGGTAVAATGQLPTGLQNAVSDLFHGSQPAVEHPSPGPSGQLPLPPPSRMHNLPPAQTDSASTAPASSPPASNSGSAPSNSGATRATEPQLAGLCQAYRAAGASAKVLSAPGFAPLVGAAGSVAAVDGLCAGLTDQGSATSSSSTSPGATPSGTVRPSTMTPGPTGTASPGSGTASPDPTGTASWDAGPVPSQHPTGSRARSGAANPSPKPKPSHRSGSPRH